MESSLFIQGKTVETKVKHFEKGAHSEEFHLLNIRDGENNINIYCDIEQLEDIKKAIEKILEK